LAWHSVIVWQNNQWLGKILRHPT